MHKLGQPAVVLHVKARLCGHAWVCCGWCGWCASVGSAAVGALWRPGLVFNARLLCFYVHAAGSLRSTLLGLGCRTWRCSSSGHSWRLRAWPASQQVADWRQQRFSSSRSRMHHAASTTSSFQLTDVDTLGELAADGRGAKQMGCIASYRVLGSCYYFVSPEPCLQAAEWMGCTA